MMISLAGAEAWGWDAGWDGVAARAGAAALETAGTWRGRVVAQQRDRWQVQGETGLVSARWLPGAGTDAGAALRPVTGDWVLLEAGPSPSDPPSIRAVLPRRTQISRGSAGGGGSEQVLAANVDLVWLVHGLDTPPNPRRMERYLALAWESGAVPEIILTKSDLCDDPAGAIAAFEAIAFGVPVRSVSVANPETIRLLRERLEPGRTVALLGPSGAGKSSLINALADAALAATGAVRETDRRGRHTTTGRELFQLPGGALLLDTPGLRELRLWAGDEGLAHTFPEIEELAAGCRYRDCRHETEPGCAVLEAVAAGQLAPDRLEGYRKLIAEAEYLERRVDPIARAADVARHKTALKTLKYHPKYRREE